MGIHAADQELLQNQLARPLLPKGLFGKMICRFSKRSMAQAVPFFTPDIWLEEAFDLSPYGICGNVICLPGHTAGSIGIDIEKRHVLVGDAMMNVTFPQASPLGENPLLLKQSVAKIKHLGRRTIYCGHGRSWKQREIGTQTHIND